MKSFMCKTCGTQYSHSTLPPASCLICEDDRQYVGKNGQEWTLLEELKQDYKVTTNEISPTLIELTITPGFAIGQRAFLCLSESGNVLWDCLPLFDADTIRYINEKGGISAIAISHPHYYSSMNEWARTFNCPVYLHESDSQWICRKDEDVEFRLWSGTSIELPGNMTIYNTQGHFPGSTVLLIPEGEGVLLSGDSININPDRKTMAMMYSYPNQIPLRKQAIEYIRDMVAPLKFNAMYSAFSHGNIPTGAKAAFIFSVNRYLNIYDC